MYEIKKHDMRELHNVNYELSFLGIDLMFPISAFLGNRKVFVCLVQLKCTTLSQEELIFIWWNDWLLFVPRQDNFFFVKLSDIFSRGQAKSQSIFSNCMIQDLILPLLTTSLAYNSKYSKLNRLNGIEWIFNLQTFVFCYKNL